MWGFVNLLRWLRRYDRLKFLPFHRYASKFDRTDYRETIVEASAVSSFLSRTSQLTHKYYSSSNRVNTQAAPYEHANNLTRVNSCNTPRSFLSIRFQSCRAKERGSTVGSIVHEYSYSIMRILSTRDGIRSEGGLEYYYYGEKSVNGRSLLAIVNRCKSCSMRVIKYNKYDNTSRMIMNEIKNWKIIKWPDKFPVTLQYTV